MKYYKITSDHSIGVIGGSTFQVLPPSNRYNSDNVDDSLNIIGSFFKGWTKDVKPNIPRLEIAKNAILTNSLSTSSFSSKYYGLVLDVELYNFFSGFKIESHITYDLDLFQTRGNINVDINNYKYLVICSEGLEHIDFARSSIVKWYHFEKGNNEELVLMTKAKSKFIIGTI